jgi:hypothetical protein
MKLDREDPAPAGCGETGTFQRLASSGSSPSDSSHSASSSFAVFRRGFHDDLRGGSGSEDREECQSGRNDIGVIALVDCTRGSRFGGEADRGLASLVV